MKRRLLLLLLLALSVGPVLAQDAPEANLTEDCVADYDPDVDYFPDQTTLSEAENFNVAYFNHYKVVTVEDAFTEAQPFTYVLVQCGTPAPDAAEFPEDAQFLEVPAGNVIALSSTQLPHLEALGLLDHLVGVDNFDFISSPAVREMIEAGDLMQAGGGVDINVEAVLEAEPDLVMTFVFDPSTSAFPVLTDAGIFTAIQAGAREATALGRAEWVKFTALFYNEEARAAEVYDNIAEQYDQARQLAASVPEDERPTVLWNSISAFSDSWAIPGSETTAGRLIQDAGGLIAPPELVQAESNFVGLEAVYENGLSAEVWVTNLFGVRTVEDLLSLEPRFEDFQAVQTGEVWNNDLDLNPNGGNNYFELGVTNPHLILQDLVAIFHPALLPEHEFNFYQRLTAAE